AFFFFAMFLRGFCAALELTYARKGRGLFFSARAFLGVGFANISMSFALKIARCDASPPLFIAVIIFSRTDLALAIAPSRIDGGSLTDSGTGLRKRPWNYAHYGTWGRSRGNRALSISHKQGASYEHTENGGSVRRNYRGNRVCRRVCPKP